MELKSGSEGSGDGDDSSMPGSPLTIPKAAASFSPKVVRPKLPACAGTRSPSRSKTDPGREEIKAILEDIQNLKKIDFRTFIRPRHISGQQPQPHPGGYSTLPYKSQSTTTSPNHSPRIGSPTVDDPHFSRDRSRSLKILTDRLKNKSGKLLGEQILQRQSSASERIDFRREGSVPTDFLRVSHGPSPDRCSVERVEEEEEEAAESTEPVKPVERKVSPAALVTISPHHSDDSLDSREAYPHHHNDTPDLQPVFPSREKTPDSDTLLGMREKSPESDDSPKPRPEENEQAVQPKIAHERVLEDEGVSEISDAPRPIISSTTHTFHPTIGRNKKFLKLVATAPCPKRRTGITTLATLGHVQAMYGRAPGEEGPYLGQAEDASSRVRRQRRSEVSPGGPRVTTHPPHKKGSAQEEGSVDSNGFSALKTSSGDSDEEAKQQPRTSSGDSHLSPEGADHVTYPDAEDTSMAGAASDTSDSEKQEKKNGKAAKQKSRSDPSGDCSRESMDIAPNLDSSQSRSAPLLNKDEEDDSVIEDEFHLARSDNTLSPPPHGFAEESGGERTSDDEDDLDMEGSAESGDVLALPPSNIPFSSAPPTPHSYSPTSTLERPASQLPSGFLTVPSASMPKKPISRSASSASVLPSRKQTLLNSRGDREPRKYSITTDEAMTPSRSTTHLVPDFTPLADSSAATSMPVVWKDRLSSTDSPEREPGFIKDKRYHIVEELYRNEKEYVEALRVLKEKYMTPLKNSSNVDDAIVDNIFYMIPEILMHHSVYLDLLDKVWKNWDSKSSTVGDLILAIFSKQTIVESYLSFVENYNTSGKVIENALTTKSSMQKFIEQCQRESGSKLSMKDLIVRPIQRIPRYELLIQRLLDNTVLEHPDYSLLQRACRTMHELAMKIGTVTDSQHEEDMQETLKKLELLLITDLVAAERAYVRHDMVQLLNKKDQCCIWLFSDLIILSSIKRKSGPVTRKVSIILKTPGGQDFTENIKHKVWLKVGLDCLEIVKSHSSTLSRKPTIDKEQVEEDLQVVTQITDLCSHLSAPHQALEEAVKELSSNLSKQLAEAALRSMASESNKLELLVTTQEGVLHLEITFLSAEKRATWELAFTDAKNKLSLLTDKRAPEFLQPLQITKTRAGMQFSCAAPIDGLNASGYRDVWVCNSDGYVGHMCLLSLQPEPIVTLNTPVPGCNARILCICAVPAFSGAFRRRSSQKGRTHRLAGEREQRPLIQVECPEQDEAEEEEKSAPSEPRRQAARGSSRSRERSGKREEERGGKREEEKEEEETDTTEEGYQSDSETSDEDDDDGMPFMRNNELYVDLQSDEEVHRPKVSELTQSSPDPITTSGSWQQDPVKSTMWLGTEDGCIHIFQCTDNIKTTKNKLKIQHGSPVYCIIYLDNKVFASLVNGDLIVYKRDSEGMWDTEHPYTRTIGSASSPITRMLAVAGKLWCGCQNTVHVINPLALNIERSFQVVSDPSRAVQCMVCSGQGVWVACQQSSKVSLFHATTYEFLLEVSVAQAVSQKLQSADDIIRQHKAACLRITALLVCKDLLWVGTSAGVILTIPIPKVTSTTTHGALAIPSVTGLVYGHTGHVRFLTAVELWSINPTQKSEVNTGRESHGAEGVVLPDIHRRSSMAATTATMATRMLVISGGDGYEDFRNNSANESAGRDDSTNHLLLWQV